MLTALKISSLVPYKNFVTDTYAAMDTIQQFVDDELTNQEFVDESVLLVNGNRMQTPNIKSL
jgi:hypothetical protein